MSDIMNRLEDYKESCLDDNGYILNGETDVLIFDAAETIESYEKTMSYVIGYLEGHNSSPEVLKVLKQAISERGK